jgi:hypothetical protein
MCVRFIAGTVELLQWNCCTSHSNANLRMLSQHFGWGAVLSLAKVWLGSHDMAFKLTGVTRILNYIINDGVLLRSRLSKP